ncbi:MAG: ABC transporter substrate-binding protein [Alphaproteobacteria bacterium]|nr:MAG: ABC transporter substrate-binding protein [Alphaproteobacteria bacterium]
MTLPNQQEFAMRIQMFFLLMLCSLSFFELSSHATSGNSGYDVSIACDSLGKKKEQCVASVKRFEDKTGLKAKVIEAPTGSSNRLAWVLQQLASKSSDIDVYQIDTTWAGLLKDHLMPLSEHISKEQTDLYHQTLIQNNTIDGQLLALPWYVDIGLLIYRKDLLEKYQKDVPKTWDALAETAEYIQQKEREAGNKKIWGYVFTAKAFEGLTCNVIEFIHSNAGQAAIGKDGTVTINTPENAEMFEKVKSWINKITPKGVLNYAEEDSRGVFQSGNAVFVRHWPYAVSLAEADESPLKGKIGVASLPAGKAPGSQSVSTLGGWQLGISKYSKRKENALKLVKFLTSKEELKERALSGNYYPPMLSLYEDTKVQDALPYWQKFLEAFQNIVARPSAQAKSKYNQVSSNIWNTAHSIFIGRKNAEVALKNLEKKLKLLVKKNQ